MKIFTAILLLMMVNILALSQNIVKLEYFLDSDAGFGQNTPVIVTPSADANFPFTINLSGVAPGYHALYFRAADSEGKWSHTSRRMIHVLPSDEAAIIVNGEYFFDQDPGFGAANPITVSPQDIFVFQNFTAAVSGLQPGYHKLYVRFKDTYGNWGQTIRRNVEILKETDSKVVSVEYFVNVDPGYGNATSITFPTPSQDGTFSFNIPLNQLPPGADTLFLRVRDSSEMNWSMTTLKAFTVQGSLPLTLLSFNGVMQNNTAQLTWQTTNEVNTAWFNIQRSTDGISFTTIGKVTAKGNASIQTGYDFKDNTEGLINSIILYRLEMADTDGKLNYSNTVALKAVGRSPVFRISPNPASTYIHITAGASLNVNSVTVVITDLAGKTVTRKVLRNANDQNVSISALAKGMYLVTIITPGNIQTQKLVVE